MLFSNNQCETGTRETLRAGSGFFLPRLFDVQGTFIGLGNTILWRSRLHVYIAQYLLLKNNTSSLCVLPKLGGCSWDQGVLVPGATFCAFGSLPGLSILAYKRRPWAWCVCVFPFSNIPWISFTSTDLWVLFWRFPERNLPCWPCVWRAVFGVAISAAPI